MTARLVSFFSGSSGNCTAINCGGNTILIDAGRSAKAIEEQLAVAGIDPGTLRAVFVTHEHIDHVSALRVLTKKHPMPVFASGGTAGERCDGIWLLCGRSGEVWHCGV